MREQFFIALDNINEILSVIMVVLGFAIGIYFTLKLGLHIFRKIMRANKEYWDIAHFFMNKEKYKELIYQQWYTIQYYPTKFTDWIMEQGYTRKNDDDSVYYGDNLPKDGMVISQIFKYWKETEIN